MITTPIPPEGYRLLNEGEIIQEGDMVLPHGRQPWIKACSHGANWTSDEYFPMCRKSDPDPLQHWEDNQEAITNALTERVNKVRNPALNSNLWFALKPVFDKVENPEDYYIDSVRDAAHDLSVLSGI